MFSALAERDYRRFWLAQFVSNIGGWMQTVAQGWLVLKLTDSAFLLGLVGFANSIPILLLMLPGGVIADHVDRRRLLRIMQSTQSAIALLLALSIYFNTVTVGQVIAAAALNGVAIAFSSPTFQALVLDLLSDRSKLANAIAMNSLQFNLSRVSGPLLAGLLLTYAGAFACFLANAFSFLPIIFTLGFIGKSSPAARESVGIGRRLVEGVSFAWRSRPIRWLLFIVASSSFFGFPYITLMPVLASVSFGRTPAGLAILMASLGAGALIGSFFLAFWSVRQERLTLILASLAIFGIALIAAAHLREPLALGGALVLAGFTMVSCVASVNTQLQLLIPDVLRARVLSIYTLSFFGVVPFGNLLSGWITERRGIETSFTLMGSGLLASSLIAWRPLSRWLRRSGTLEEAATAPQTPPSSTNVTS